MLEITDIRLSLDEGRDETSCLAALRCAAAHVLSCEPSALSQVELRRRAVDARRKSDVHLICTARVSTGDAWADEALLVTREYQKRLAEVICRGTIAFLAAGATGD